MSVQKGWANPSPAGLVALAVGCFCFFAMLTGKVEHSCIPVLACWMLGGFLVQVLVGIIELREGNTTVGNVFTFFGAFFMLVGGMACLVKFTAGLNGWVIDTRIDGWAWLALTIALLMWTPAFFKGPSVMTLLVVLIDIALPIITFMDMKVLSSSYAPIAGYALLGAGILAVYVSAAHILNAAFGKQVLPMLGPIIK